MAAATATPTTAAEPRPPPRPGQRVRWTEAGRWFSGRFVREVACDLVIKGEPLPASPAAPRWLLQTAAGAYAAHPPEAVVLVEDAADPRQGELDL